MSQQIEGNTRTFKAAVDLSTKLFYIVKLTAANTVNLAAAATDAAIMGVINRKPAAAVGANIEVLLRTGAGTGKVILGGTVSRGDRLTTNASGQAITTTTAANEVIGMAIEAGVSGDVIEFLPVIGLYAIT